MAMIYFLDGNQEVIKIVRSSAVISAIQTQELPEDNSLLRDSLAVRLKNDEKLFDAQYMAVKSHDGNRNSFDMYRIINEIVPDNATDFEGVQVAPYELSGVVVEDIRPTNQSFSFVMGRLLADTDWRVGYVDSNLPSITTVFYYLSVKDSLKKMQDLTGAEMIFKVEISGNKITDKWVEVYRQLGNRTQKRFNYGTNALSVVRETSSNELYTALIGRGKGEEVGETEAGDATYGRKIDFADVVWTTAGGKPVNKPKGQKYIELPQATAEYGIKLIDGRKVPRIGIVEFNDTEDPEELINQTWQALQEYARPKVLFSATVANIGATGIGDTVTIHRHDLNMHYQTRVRKVIRDKKNDNKTQVEIGDVVHTPSTKRQANINSNLNNLESNLNNVQGEVERAVVSADGKNMLYFQNEEPTHKRVGDSWIRDHPSLAGETQWLVWNGEAWEIIMDSSVTNQAAKKAEDARQEAEEALDVANESLGEIMAAIQAGGFTSLLDMTSDQFGRIANVELISSGLQTTVGDSQTGLVSQVTQLSTGLASVVKDLDSNDPSSIIYQLQDSIGSVVQELPTNKYDWDTSNGFALTVYLKDTYAKETLDVSFKFNHSGFRNQTLRVIAYTDTDVLISIPNVLVDGDGYIRFTIPSHTSRPINRFIINITAVSTWSGISDVKVFSTNNPISQINQTAENILIRVGDNKLNITNDSAYLGNQVITDRMIATDAEIDGAKIEDATITNAKITSLDVKKISGETAEFIQAGFNSISTGNRLEVNSDGLKINTTSTWNLELGNAGINMISKSGVNIAQLRASLTSTGQPEGMFSIAERGYKAGLGVRRANGELSGSIWADGTTERVRIAKDVVLSTFGSSEAPINFYTSTGEAVGLRLNSGTAYGSSGFWIEPENMQSGFFIPKFTGGQFAFKQKGEVYSMTTILRNAGYPNA